MKAYAQSAGYAEQALQAIKIVHTYGQESLELTNFSRYLSTGNKINTKINIRQAFSFGFMMASFYAFYAYAFYFGGYLKWKEIKNPDGREYSGGAIIAIMFSTVFGAATAGSMSPHLKAFSETQIAGKLAYDTIDHEPKIKSSEKGTTLASRAEIKGQYEFKNVQFNYPSRDDVQVLKGFSCVFEEGKTTALVGPSGSGKSTIIQMLERFYDPTHGQVLLDGKDLKSYNLRSLRQLIGYVPQEPILFNATIRENMLFGKPDASENEIIDALKAAKAWDFIQKTMKENGIDTQVGGSGSQLSGGQKQRIAIARAFLKQPKILLLDEATSALDKVNERAIQDAIDNYRKTIGNITTVVIAHRLSTIRDADKIVVMKNGVLEEMGNHEELLQKYPEGIYAGFCAKQASAEAQATATDSPSKLVEQLVEADMAEDQTGGDKFYKEQLKKADEIDQKEQDHLDELAKENEKVSGFSKLFPYNNPKSIIPVAVLGAILNGSFQPILGVLFAKLLNYLSVPFVYLGYKEFEDEMLKGNFKTEEEMIAEGKRITEENVTNIVYIFIIFAVAT